MKKVIINGRPGSGKTYFYLPELIKAIQPQVSNIYQLQVEQLKNEQHIGPHWEGIKFQEYDSQSITKNDLIFCDEISFIEEERTQNILATHPFLVLTSLEPLNEFEWLDHTKFVKIESEYIKPQTFMQKLLNDKTKAKIKELASKV